MDEKAFTGASMGQRIEPSVGRLRSDTASEISGNAGQLMRVVEQVMIDTETLEKTLIQLTERLQPILASGGPEAVDGRNRTAASAPGVSQVTNMLAQTSEKLQLLRMRLQSLGARLEV